MKKLRVLRVLARMNVGGPAVQVSALATGLDPSRFESRLLVGAVGPGEADHLELRGKGVPYTKVTGLGRAPRPLDDARALAQIVREIRRFRPHIVHTHTAKAGVLGRLGAGLTRVPIRVHHFHGHLLHGYFTPTKTRAVVEVERLLARSTTRLLTVGSQVRAELLAAGIGRPEQYGIMPPGVDLGAVPPRSEARRALGIPGDASVLAYVGRLTQVKRPDRLLDVVADLASRRDNLVTLVVGDGELRTGLETDNRARAGEIRFLGWRGDVETVYAAADVVVLTSDNEGMPVSLIEAAMAGRPTVTTRVGSAPEVVVDGVTGLVTAPAVPELVAALERVLDDEELRTTMGESARVRAEREFSAARLIRDTEDLYEQLACARPGP